MQRAFQDSDRQFELDVMGTTPATLGTWVEEEEESNRQSDLGQIQNIWLLPCSCCLGLLCWGLQGYEVTDEPVSLTHIHHVSMGMGVGKRQLWAKKKKGGGTKNFATPCPRLISSCVSHSLAICLPQGLESWLVVMPLTVYGHLHRCPSCHFPVPNNIWESCASRRRWPVIPGKSGKKSSSPLMNLGDLVTGTPFLDDTQRSVHLDFIRDNQCKELMRTKATPTGMGCLACRYKTQGKGDGEKMSSLLILGAF